MTTNNTIEDVPSINREDKNIVEIFNDSEILRLAGPSEDLDVILHRELSRVMSKPFMDAIQLAGTGKDADEKAVKKSLVRAMREQFEEKMPVAYRPAEDMYYVYVPSLCCYIAINHPHICRMLLTIASQAHSELRKANDERPEMPSPKDLTSAFNANVGPTVDGLNEVDQWVTMIFLNCFINLAGEINRRVSFEPIEKEVFHTQTLKVALIDVPESPGIWTKFCQSIGFGAPEMQAGLEDILFYLISPSIGRHEAFFLLGSGRNGKSVLLNFLRKVIGPCFVGAASLEQFQKNFGLEPLLNKRLSLSSESGSGDFVDSKTFKAIVSGDTVQVDRKNITAVTVTLQLKLAFALNETPTIIDKSDGMYERIRVLQFLKIIPAEERIDRYEDHLFQYGSEIVSWWVISHFKRHGRYNLKFKLPPIFEEWKKEIFVTGTDPVEAFIVKCLEDAQGERVSFQEVLTEFKIFILTHNWSGSGRISAMGPQALGRRLVTTYRRMNDRQLESRPSNGIRYYLNVRLVHPVKGGR